MKTLHINSKDNFVPMVPYMPMEPKPGYGYVPYQTNPMYYNNINEAFVYGTIFPELVTPYLEFFQRGVQS
ncbi:MAG: spore coat associated protein CotJA [Sedimentibacter sp.]